MVQDLPTLGDGFPGKTIITSYFFTLHLSVRGRKNFVGLVEFLLVVSGEPSGRPGR
jgi:hypothetical protein